MLPRGLRPEVEPPQLVGAAPATHHAELESEPPEEVHEIVLVLDPGRKIGRFETSSFDSEFAAILSGEAACHHEHSIRGGKGLDHENNIRRRPLPYAEVCRLLLHMPVRMPCLATAPETRRERISHRSHDEGVASSSSGRLRFGSDISLP